MEGNGNYPHVPMIFRDGQFAFRYRDHPDNNAAHKASWRLGLAAGQGSGPILFTMWLH